MNEGAHIKERRGVEVIFEGLSRRMNIFNVSQEQKTRLGKTLGVMLSTFQNDVPYLVGYVGIYNLKDNQLEHYRSIYERVDLGNTYDWDIDYLLLKISKRIPPEYMSSDDTLQDGAKNPH